jgi:hypothetical protein
MAKRFALTHFLLLAVGVAAWQAGLLGWVSGLPRSTWLMIAFLGLMWLAGVCFALAAQWRSVFHVANAIPLAGLIMTGLGIQIAGVSISEMSPEAALALFRGILQSMSTTFIGLALMVALRETAYWCSGTHL